MKDPQVKEMLEKIDAIKKELKDKVAELIEKHGYTPASIRKYLNDPKNFTPAQWTQIQKQKDDITKAIGIAIDPMMRKQTKVVEKAKGDRAKNKSIGARKRWMPMQ